MKWSMYLHTARDGTTLGLFNAMTGGFARLEERVVSSLGEIRPGGEFRTEACPPSIFASLVYGGFLVRDWEDELLKLRSAHDSARYNPTSFVFTLVPTLDCNLSCVYCFENKAPTAMDLTVQNAIVTLARKMSEGPMRNLVVTWYGGEPLLCLDVIKHISRSLNEACGRNSTRVDYNMITNGVLLTRDTAEQLAAVGVRQYQVTIDGVKTVHDKRKPLKGGGSSFERIIENLKSLSGRDDIVITLRVNIDRRNVDGVEPLIDFLVGEGLVNQKSRRCYMAPVQDWNQGGCLTYPKSCFIPEEEFARLELDINEMVYRRYGFEVIEVPGPHSLPCAAISPFSAVIGPTGELYKCWTDVGMDQYIAGHVKLPGIALPTMFTYSRLSAYDSADCRGCSIFPVCAGGCPAKPFRGLETVSGHFCSRERYRMKALLDQQLSHRLSEVRNNAG